MGFAKDLARKSIEIRKNTERNAANAKQKSLASASKVDSIRKNLFSSTGPSGPLPALEREAVPGITAQTDVLPQFQLARKRLGQQTVQDEQRTSDALNRRFAALGNFGGGAQIKIQQQAEDAARRRRDSASEGLDAAEATERQRRAEFQEGIRQQALGRNQQRDLANFDRQFQERVFNFDKNSKLAQFDLALEQFTLDRDTNEFNRRLAIHQAGKKGGFFGIGGSSFEG